MGGKKDSRLRDNYVTKISIWYSPNTRRQMILLYITLDFLECQVQFVPCLCVST